MLELGAPIALVDCGRSHFFAAEATHDRRRGAVDWSISWWGSIGNSLHVERQPLTLLQPEHPSFRRGARALRGAAAPCPSFAGSRRGPRSAGDLLLQEIDRQVLADGGHAERSAHYHRYSTDFYLLALLVARATGDPAPPQLSRTRCARQAAYLRDHHRRQRAPSAARRRRRRAAVPIRQPARRGTAATRWPRRPSSLQDTSPRRRATRPKRRAGSAARPAADQSASPSRCHGRRRRCADSGYFVSRIAARRPSRLRRRAARIPERRPRARRRVVAVAYRRGRPLLVDPGTGDLHDGPGAARPDAVHGDAQHRRRQRAAAVAAARPVSLADATDARSMLVADRSRNSTMPKDATTATVRSCTRARVLAIHGFGWLIIDHLLGTGRRRPPTRCGTFIPPGSVRSRHTAVSLRCGRWSAALSTRSRDRYATRDDDGLRPVFRRFTDEFDRATLRATHIDGPLPAAWLSFDPSISRARRDASRSG